jgi:hemoglobin
MQREHTLHEQLGGTPVVRAVHRIFYDRVYEHPWLCRYFEGVERQVIENQQTDFMVQAMGGPDAYCGKYPVPAHAHMFITEELFDLRHRLLADSIRDAGVCEALAARWLKIDEAFKGRLCKKSPADCVGRFKTEPIIVVPKP